MNITTIINYCSNEYQFLEEAVKSVNPFSNQTLVVMSDHLFDGTKETDKDIQNATNIINNSSELANLILFEYDHNITLEQGTRYWHNMCRWVGVNSMYNTTDYVLFLDADEICITNSFISWLNTQYKYLAQTTKFSNYFYFRDKLYQAKTWEESIVLAAHREYSHNPEVMFAMERDSIFEAGLTKRRNVNGINGLPMFNHYSWVRTKEQMLFKVKNWGHNKDKDWTSLVELEFSHPFNGTDFVHGYEYNILDLPLPKTMAEGGIYQ